MVGVELEPGSVSTSALAFALRIRCWVLESTSALRTRARRSSTATNSVASNSSRTQRSRSDNDRSLPGPRTPRGGRTRWDPRQPMRQRGATGHRSADLAARGLPRARRRALTNEPVGDELERLPFAFREFADRLLEWTLAYESDRPNTTPSPASPPDWRSRAVRLALQQLEDRGVAQHDANRVRCSQRGNRPTPRDRGQCDQRVDTRVAAAHASLPLLTALGRGRRGSRNYLFSRDF